MKDNLRESLSALMDNEGDELELRRVLKTIDDSPDAAEVWRRYHLARSLMQRDRGVDVSADLAAGVMARIEADPIPAPEAGRSRRHSLSFAGNAAVAAAVSLMVIAGVQFYDGGIMTPSELAEVGSGGSEVNRRIPESGVQPAASWTLGDSSAGRAASSLPFIQSSPVADGGLVTVGAENGMPMFMAPNQRQSQHADREQARLLQSYLDRHAQGVANRSGEAWMPLLRASSQESLGTR